MLSKGPVGYKFERGGLVTGEIQLKNIVLTLLNIGCGWLSDLMRKGEFVVGWTYSPLMLKHKDQLCFSASRIPHDGCWLFHSERSGKYCLERQRLIPFVAFQTFMTKEG